MNAPKGTSEPIRLGMVGGGEGAFIGAVHRLAARLDGKYELVAGALSSDPERSQRSGEALGLHADRIYDDYAQMAVLEGKRPDGIDAVAIVTPNHMHVKPAIAFLQQGIHVICDKPLSARLDEAQSLAGFTPKNGAKFLLTHNYTGYPLIRQAKAMVERGDLGEIRLVQSEYLQDWLTEEVHNKQADWRTDPALAGAGALGDIGTHAYNLLRFVTGLPVKSISADVHSFVPGRQVDDNAHVHLRFASGAAGSMWISQVAPGNENGLRLRIYGTKGGLEWAQEDPNKLWFAPFGQPKQLLTRAGAGTEPGATRVPAGHPEGYIEGFANLYSDFADVIRSGEENPDLPTIADGLEGLRFVGAALTSWQQEGAWTPINLA